MKRISWLLLLSIVLMLAMAACQPTEVATEEPEEEMAEEEPAEEEPAEEEMAEEEPAEEPAEEEEAASDEPILIGASLPLTGAFSIAGELHQNGYELCVNKINEAGGLLGRPVELIISDNQSDTETALTQYERLIQVEQVDLIFGTFSSRLTFPTSAVAEQNNFVNPVPAGAAIRIYERGFEKIFYWQQNAAELVGYSPVEVLTELVPEGEGPTTAAVVNSEDFFANSIRAGLTGEDVLDPGSGDVIMSLAPGAIEDAGIEVVFETIWPEEGFSDWIGLANQLRNADADVVFAMTASPEEAIQLTNAMATVGYQPKAVYLSQGTQAEYYEGVGDAANGVMIHTAWHLLATWEGELLGEPYGNQDFIADYNAEFGIDPDEDAAIPFSLCQGITNAVETIGTTDQDELADYLHARTADDPIRTILGEFYWDERGLPINRAFLMTQWQDGELNFIYPTDEFEGVSDFIYPKPEW